MCIVVLKILLKLPTIRLHISKYYLIQKAMKFHQLRANRVFRSGFRVVLTKEVRKYFLKNYYKKIRHLVNLYEKSKRLIQKKLIIVILLLRKIQMKNYRKYIQKSHKQPQKSEESEDFYFKIFHTKNEKLLKEWLKFQLKV